MMAASSYVVALLFAGVLIAVLPVVGAVAMAAGVGMLLAVRGGRRG